MLEKRGNSELEIIKENGELFMIRPGSNVREKYDNSFDGLVKTAENIKEGESLFFKV